MGPLNSTIKINVTEDSKVTFSTHCIVCDEPVELTAEEELRLKRGHDIGSKVCDKCKQAIMYVRNHLDI